jgi:molybdopterin biosynthesis enzyme MoaB
LERSRATLVRDLRGFLLRFASMSGDPSTVEAVMSRATLGVQGQDFMGDFREKLAALSRGSLGVRPRP